MANYNIVAKNISVSTSSGTKNYYNMVLVDEDTGQIKSAVNTTSEVEAKKYIAETRMKHSDNVTINGKHPGDLLDPNAGPFSDGTFNKQKNYEKDENLDLNLDPQGALESQNYSNYESHDTFSDYDSSLPPMPLGGGESSLLPSMFSLSLFEKPARDLSGASEGGKGHTQCDAVDLVAGLGGYNPREVEKIDIKGADKIESEIKTNPNFMLDSARIYVSQKTDVDKNFGIGKFGVVEEGAEDNRDDKDIGKYGAKSAVVAKADNIRIIGRESIRIVTGTDKFNSQGGEVLGKSGIEIVAMNDTKTLQPMVLGKNLIELLDKLIGQVEDVSNWNHANIKYQMKMNQAMQQHVHLSPFFALPTTQSPQAAAGGIQCDIETMTKTELSAMKQSTNLQGMRHNYLTESGEKYINSKLNKVN